MDHMKCIICYNNFVQNCTFWVSNLIFIFMLQLVEGSTDNVSVVKSSQGRYTLYAGVEHWLSQTSHNTTGKSNIYI